MMKILDTNILINEHSLHGLMDEPIDCYHIPVEVLSELDNLKTKPGEIGYKAREAIRTIRGNEKRFKFLFLDDVEKWNRNNYIVDDIILKHAIDNQPAELITNDFNMEIKAKAYGVPTSNYFGKEKEKHKHLYTVKMTGGEYANFLSRKRHQKLECVPIGQFARIVDSNDEVLGEFRYLGHDLWDKIAKEKVIKNHLFNVKARDIHQRCAIRSLEEDDFTVITGPAGSGKTLLSLGEALRRANKRGSTVHVFVNPVKTRDTAELGYYPGTRDEKLLSNFIGGILATKCGDEIEVERLIDIGALKIYPFSDIRGIEIKNGDVLYITEAQNLSVDLIKLAIQRCADGAKIIIEGDAEAQVDKHLFEGENNGLNRVIEVFTGTDQCDFGYVHLPTIYRSRMAMLAERL